MVAKRIDGASNKPRRPPAATPEAREIELQSLAYDTAERMMRDGNAPAQIVTHFLKAGSVRDRLEVERLKQENLLTQARIEQIASSASQEALLKEAMRAFTEYRGEDVLEEE